MAEQNNKQFHRQKQTREDFVYCISCDSKIYIVSFKMDELNPNNTKTIFKCKNCGKTMTRLEYWK